MRIFFKQNGVSLIELLVGALLLVIIGLLVSSLFLRGSINLITSGEENVALSCMQELAEEVRGAARDSEGLYSYIVMRRDNNAGAVTDHYHVNIPTIVHSNTNASYTVVAHTNNNERNVNDNNTVNIGWQPREGGIGTPTSNSVTMHQGIGNESLKFPDLPTGITRARGYLYIQEGFQRKMRGIIVYPQEGEQIREGKQLIGTRTAVFELFDDPLDNNPPDLLPEDYMKGTITFTWQERKGTGVNKKELVTIIAPFPE